MCKLCLIQDDLAPEHWYEVYEAHKLRLNALAKEFHLDADAVFNQVWLKIKRLNANYDPSKGSRYSYLRTVFRRCCIDLKKRESLFPAERESRERLDGIALDVASDAAHESKIILQVRSFYEGLSNDDKLVLQIVISDMVSVSFVAETLRKSKSAVRVRKHRLLKRLRRWLSDNDN